jgi:hypothetical protein
MENISIKVHEDTYLMLQEMASEQGRKMVKVVEMLVLAEYLKTHEDGKPETTEAPHAI